MRSIFRHPVFGQQERADSPGQMPRAPVPLSMIDVVFLLLTFLLLKQFPLAEGLLSMPLAGQAGRSVESPRHTLWIQVTQQDGQASYRLNDWPQTRSAEELIERVRGFVRASGADNVAVVVGAGEGVPFDRLVELWEACRAMGVTRLALPARPE